MVKRGFTIGILVSAVLLFAFSACQQAQSGQSAMISAQGFKAESLLSGDTLVLFKIGTQDKSQQENLQKILDSFPKEGVSNLIKSLATEFDKQLAQDDLSLQNDLIPAFGKNLQLLFGISGKIGGQDQDTLVIIPLLDTAKFDNIFDKLVERGKYQKSIYLDAPIYAKTDTYIGRYKDFLVVSSQMKILQQAIDRASHSNNSLLQNASYQKGLAKISNAGSLGFFYFNAKDFFAQLSSEAQKTGMSQEQINNSQVFQQLEGEIFAFSAEPEGVRVKVDVYANGDAGFLQAPIHESYLYKKIQDNNTVFYIEVYNLKKILELNAKAFDQIAGFNQAIATLRLAMSSQGIDVNQDLMSFLDKGIALDFADWNGLIPNLSIYIDAGSNPESAKKVVKKIYDLINLFIVNITKGDGSNGGSLPDKLLTNQPITGSTYMYDLTFHPDLLPKQQLDLLPQELAHNIDLVYGLNADNLLSFQLNPESTKEGQNLDKNVEFNKDMVFMKGFDNGLGFVNFGSLMDYIGQVIKFSQAFGNSSADDTTAQFESLKPYFAPFKSFIFASAKPRADEVQMQGFLRVGSF